MNRMPEPGLQGHTSDPSLPRSPSLLVSFKSFKNTITKYFKTEFCLSLIYLLPQCGWNKLGFPSNSGEVGEKCENPSQLFFFFHCLNCSLFLQKRHVIGIHGFICELKLGVMFQWSCACRRVKASKTTQQSCISVLLRERVRFNLAGFT